MNKITKIAGLLVIIALSGCASHRNHYQPVPQGEFVKIKLGQVNVINARGPFNLNIAAGASKNEVYLPADHGNVSAVRQSMRKGVLELKSTKANATVNISVSNLKVVRLLGTHDVTVKAIQPSYFSLDAKDAKNVYVLGNITLFSMVTAGQTSLWATGPVNIGTLNNLSSGVISIKGLKSPEFRINNYGPGHVVIKGSVHNGTIRQYGTGTIDLTWKNSFKTDVLARGNGIVKLSGKTKTLVAELHDQTRLQAKHFKAKDVTIKTYDQSHSQVRACRQLFANAMGTSQVDYFGRPKLLYPHSSQQGLVLPLHY